MDDMWRRRKVPGLLAVAAAPLLAAACGGEPPPPLDPSSFQPIPLAPCEEDPADGLAPEQRSIVAMIAALHARAFQIHQVSHSELAIFTRFREVQGIPIAWEIRFQPDGAGALAVAETTPPQDARAFRRIREWGRKLAGTFDNLKCRPSAELRARCERAGFTF